jgi:hypothetical protein
MLSRALPARPPCDAPARYRCDMTTAIQPCVDWVRLKVGEAVVALDPLPGIELRIVQELVEYPGYVDPLARPPLPEFHLAVDLCPRNAEDVVRCEEQARRVAAQLGLGSRILREFAMRAAFVEDGLPYNRLEAPRLLLASDEAPELDDEGPVPFVRAFTAKVPNGCDTAYTLHLVN